MKGRICLLLCIIACHSCVNEKTHVNQIIDEISIYDNQVKNTSSSTDIDNKNLHMKQLVIVTVVKFMPI